MALMRPPLLPTLPARLLSAPPRGGKSRRVCLCAHQHSLIITLLCGLFKIVALVTSDIRYQKKPDKHTQIFVQPSVYLLHVCG